MQCRYCLKEFQPKQQFCSTTCRVYAHLKYGEGKKAKPPVKKQENSPIARKRNDMHAEDYF